MDEKKQEQPPDRGLDIPSEASRDKHVNFLADDDGSNVNKAGREDKDRRKQWEDGLKEGREARDQNKDS